VMKVVAVRVDVVTAAQTSASRISKVVQVLRRRLEKVRVRTANNLSSKVTAVAVVPVLVAIVIVIVVRTVKATVRMVANNVPEDVDLIRVPATAPTGVLMANGLIADRGVTVDRSRRRLSRRLPLPWVKKFRASSSASSAVDRQNGEIEPRDLRRMMVISIAIIMVGNPISEAFVSRSTSRLRCEVDRVVGFEMKAQRD